MKLSSKTEELKSALANGAIPYSADVDFFFFEIEVIDFSLGFRDSFTSQHANLSLLWTDLEGFRGPGGSLNPWLGAEFSIGVQQRSSTFNVHPGLEEFSIGYHIHSNELHNYGVKRKVEVRNPRTIFLGRISSEKF